MSGTAIKADREFTNKICEQSGVQASACYQCMKCTAGCPVAEKSDSSPAHVLRSVVLGLKDELLASEFIWMCVGCETCKTRCPQDLSARQVIDALKDMAIQENAQPGDKKIPLMMKTFLNIVKMRGRMNEPLLMAYYKLGTKEFTEDMALGMQMIKKGKMGLNPFSGRIKGAAEVRNIIETKGGKK